MAISVTYVTTGVSVPTGYSPPYGHATTSGPIRNDITVRVAGSDKIVDPVTSKDVFRVVIEIIGLSDPDPLKCTHLDTAFTVISNSSTQGFSVRSGDANQFGNLKSAFLLTFTNLTSAPNRIQAQVGVKGQGGGQNTVYVFSKGIGTETPIFVRFLNFLKRFFMGK